jgi:hypothetical protein
MHMPATQVQLQEQPIDADYCCVLGVQLKCRNSYRSRNSVFVEVQVTQMYITLHKHCPRNSNVKSRLRTTDLMHEENMMLIGTPMEHLKVMSQFVILAHIHTQHVGSIQSQ